MRNSTYSDMNTPGVVVNYMVLTGSDLPDDSAQFNSLIDSQDSYITAGRFTYTEGDGPGGSEGVYEYIDGTGIDSAAPSWESYFDANDPTNVWTRGVPPN